jgi:hypothetical protein
MNEIDARKKVFRRLQVLCLASVLSLVLSVLLFASAPSTPHTFWSAQSIVGLLLGGSALVFLIRFWRCPACGRNLENKWPKKERPWCGKVLR